MSRILLAVLCLALGAAIGAAVEMRTRLASELAAEARRGVRVALDLPKDWDASDRLPAADGAAAVPCPAERDPIVIATGGQSNAANTNSGADEREPSPDVLTFHEGACHLAASPMLGATGGRGSLWPALGDALAARTGRPVVFVNGAVGGTEFTDWLDPRSGYLAALEDRIAGAAAAGMAPDLLLWHQGETDAAVSSGAEESEAKLTALTAALLEAAPGATVYLFRASRCRRGEEGGEPVPFLTEAQTHVAEADPRIVAGMDTDALGDDFRWDGCHFNSAGREAIVKAVAPELAALLRDDAAG